jgi:hypothetical protein
MCAMTQNFCRNPAKILNILKTTEERKAVIRMLKNFIDLSSAGRK